MGAEESKTRLPADSIVDGVIHTSLPMKKMLKKYNFPTKWRSFKKITYKQIIENNEIQKFKDMYEKGDLFIMKAFSCSNILDGEIGNIYHVYCYDRCKLNFDNLKFNNSLIYYLE
jgi:hypothetical protein